MNLSTLAGNQRIKDRLSRREWDRGLSHAYIISGPAGSGRHALARRLAAAMLCTGGGERPCGTCPACLKTEKGIHPDFSVTAGPEAGKPITVDQVRALRSDAYIRPNEGERKVYLLEEADRMNPSAQNAMLKLLEEGPAYAAFLLIAGNTGGLLQTVRSRCEELALTPRLGPGAAGAGRKAGRRPGAGGGAGASGDGPVRAGRQAEPGGAVRLSGRPGESAGGPGCQGRRAPPPDACGGPGEPPAGRGPAQCQRGTALGLAVLRDVRTGAVILHTNCNISRSIYLW